MTDADYSLKIITLGESWVGKTKILVNIRITYMRIVI